MFLGPWDPLYFVILAPAILLMAWAQWRVSSAYGRAMQMPARLSGCNERMPCSRYARWRSTIQVVILNIV